MSINFSEHVLGVGPQGQLPPFVFDQLELPDANERAEMQAIQDQFVATLDATDPTVANRVRTQGTDTRAALDGGFASMAVLDPPVFDKATNPIYRHLTHPDVLHFATPWNGYRYWMTYTPIPDNREAPHIAASHDGVNWELPPGAPIPVAPYSELDPGFDFFSDSDLVMLDANNTTMAMFYRATDYDGPGRVYRKTTTDGSTWSPPATVIDVPSEELASPALVREDNGNLTMWSINMVAPARSRIERRTSTDGGLTWSAPTTCTISYSGISGEKHIDVIKDGTTYHALVMTTASRLYHITSTNGGLTWSGPTTPIPRSTTGVDSVGHYRSSLIKSPTHPGRFDLYLAAIPSGSNNQRLVVVRGYDLTTPALVEARARQAEAAAATEIWVPADRFHVSLGTPTMGTVLSNNFRGWVCDDSTLSQINAIVPVPRGWATFSVEIIWALSGAGTAGGVVLQSKNEPWTIGSNLNAGGPAGTVTVAADTTTDLLRATKTQPSTTMVGDFVSLKLLRRGADAADTRTGNIIIFGARLTRVS